MTATARWLTTLGALAIGFAGAVAFAADDPLAPENLSIRSRGPASAVSYDGSDWAPVSEGFEWSGLTVLHPTYVRGPARIGIVAGTFVDVPEGCVVLLSWEPAVRGWRILTVEGEVTVTFPNACARLARCCSMTLTSGGDVYRGPSGYAPSPVTGLEGLPEVSLFLAAPVDKK